MALPAVRNNPFVSGGSSGSSMSVSFVVERFRAFYTQVIDAKQELGVDQLDLPKDNTLEHAIDQLAASLCRRLVTLLERDALESARQGGSYGATLFRQAQYAMAALADEILIHELEWPGRTAWREHLLEMALFKSQDAGDRFFDNIEEILRQRDPVTIDLAVVYLLCLKLGFQGKYRGEDRIDELDYYRTKLFAFITNREPTLFRNDLPVFTNAYAHTRDDKLIYRVSPLRRWQLATVGAVVVFFIAAQIVWETLTGPLLEMIRSIL